MKKNMGIWICSILFFISGLLQFLALLQGAALLGLVAFGSLFLGLAMLAVAYGIWKLRAWGRALGIMLAILQIALGGLMGALGPSVVDLLLAGFGIIIIYFLLIDKNTKKLFKS